MIKVIFAHSTGPDNHHAFGYFDNLPWKHLPEDLKQFKEFTKDCVLLMGARTFESLPSKLPGRMHVVLSSKTVHAKNGDTPDMCITQMQVPDILGMLTDLCGQTVAVIGGPALIEACIQYADEVRITEVHQVNDYTVDIDVDSIKESMYNHTLETQEFNGFTVSTYRKK
ncbi:MAG: dihydrofolate reductase [Culicoidibacterales bacterium]